jgi:predicted O-methyltransferase YrrM
MTEAATPHPLPSGGPAWSPGIARDSLRFGAHLVANDQRLLLDYLRWLMDRSTPMSADSSFRSAVRPVGLDEARARIAGRQPAWQAGPAVRAVRDYIPGAIESKSELRMAGDSSLGELVYTLVRELRPAVVVETGVAQGVTSAYILAGLEDNGSGELHSIDMPPREMINERLVGLAVPQNLRARWTYHWGPARRLLPPLLEKLGSRLGLFVHDSDHSYANMHWELQTAWKSLAPGGWLVADDAELHPAVRDVARSLSAEPLYVSQVSKAGWTAMITKPPR